jgi:murein DD-endopeptidase MepM/ murein hydrolase activator NlpD
MSSVLSCPGSGFSKASLLVSAAAAVMLSGCSSAVDRFAQNPSDADPVYTASVPKNTASSSTAAADDNQVTSQPLASSTTKKPLYSYNTAANTSAPQQPVYKQPVYKAPAVAQAEAPAGASTVTVGQGTTLYGIAKANNITVSKLAAYNGLKPPYAVHQGQVLKIPAAGAAVAATTSHAAQSVAQAEPAQIPFKKKAASSASGGTHDVTSGETLFSLGRKYGVSPYAIADLNGLPHNAALKLGQTVKIPGAGATVAEAQPKATAKKATQTAKADIQDTTDDGAAADAAATPKKDATVAAAVPAPDNSAAAAAPAPQVSADAGVAGMRWPVRGRVISEFGAKPNGLKNEGINIAVPEGTSVRAADDGVVAYAGNELKGYGNLVLIRHTGGWVTAYAHAKELFVKRGDTVKRGDVIAKAGQTGSVTSPQLHFEVRKGAVAMDPLKYLDSTTASN